jgi:hypothetical protein
VKWIGIAMQVVLNVIDVVRTVEKTRADLPGSEKLAEAIKQISVVEQGTDGLILTDDHAAARTELINATVRYLNAIGKMPAMGREPVTPQRVKKPLKVK